MGLADTRTLEGSAGPTFPRAGGVMLASHSLRLICNPSGHGSKGEVQAALNDLRSWKRASPIVTPTPQRHRANAKFGTQLRAWNEINLNTSRNLPGFVAKTRRNLAPRF